MAGKTNISKINSKLGLFKRQLRKEGLGDARLFLFGSWAKGKENEWSDIDICVVSDKFGSDYWEEERKLNKIANLVDYAIEPVAMRPQDLKDKYSTLASEIRKWGVAV